MRKRPAMSTLLRAAFTAIGLFFAATPRSVAGEESELATLTRALRNGEEDAAPKLEALFASTNRIADRQRIAWLLVTSGHKDDIYIKFLTDAAERAIADPTPSPFKIVDGSIQAGQYDERFSAWCASTGISPEEAQRRATEDLPAAVFWLARTGDSRAFDVLMRGLHHPNPLISLQAAYGLGLIGDTRALGPLMEVARTAPKGNEVAYARALSFFDDERATRLGAELVGDEKRFLELRARVLRENGRTEAGQ